jgi:hypothetical protein
MDSSSDRTNPARMPTCVPKAGHGFLHRAHVAARTASGRDQSLFLTDDWIGAGFKAFDNRCQELKTLFSLDLELVRAGFEVIRHLFRGERVVVESQFIEDAGERADSALC